MVRAVSLMLVFVMLSSGLAGCLGAEDGGQTEPPAPPFTGLSAPNATETRRNAADGTLTFVFEGAREDLLPDGIAWTFQVDDRVGYVEVNLTSQAPPIGANGVASSGVVVELVDQDGRTLCEAAGGALVEACSSMLPSTVDEAVDWQVEADVGGSGTAEDETFTVEVTLHPPSHVARQDPRAGTDRGVRFVVHDTGVRDESGMEEPSVGTLGDGSIFVQAGLQTLRSTDDGESWTNVTPATAPPTAFDPILETDPYTGRVYVDQLTIACSWMAWSADAGESWTTNPAACGMPDGDHQKLGIGPPMLPAGGAPTVYYGFSTAGSPEPTVWVSRSMDGGFTFPTTAPVAGPSTGDNPRNTGPLGVDRDGTVFMPLVLCGDGIEGGPMAVAVSQDQGMSFEVHVVDEEPRTCAAWGSDMAPAVGTDGTLYVAYQRPSGMKYVFSTDRGSSWSDPVGVPSANRGTFLHPAAAAGEDGRLAITYRATADASGPSDYVPGWVDWHQYATIVENATGAEPTFTTALVNEPSDPIRRGALCTGWGAVGFCPADTRVLLDFIDASVLPDGRFVVAYSDACQLPCPTPADSQDVRLFVAVQQTGPRLFTDQAPWAGGPS